MIKTVNQRIAIGATWMMAMRFSERLIGFGSVLVLARLLLPADFGLVGYAMAFFGILSVFFEFSFHAVLIRDQDAPRENYDTAFTLDFVIGLLLAVMLVAGAKPMASFFSEPNVEAILYWLALLPALRGLENVGIVDFQKNMEFHKEFYFNFSVRVLGTLLTIVLAFWLRTYWALVAGMVLRAILRVGLSYIMSSYRPRFGLAGFSRVFGFSKWLLIHNSLSGVIERLPIFVLGRYFPAQMVGLFNMAIELSHLASQEIAAPIRRALFPGISQVAEDEGQMVQTLCATIGAIAFIGLPITVGIAVAAPVIVPVLLGETWVEMIPIMQVLAVNAVTYVLYSNSHVVLYAVNKPHVTAQISALKAAILIPGVLYLAPIHGAIGAAAALSLANIVMLFVDYAIVFRMVNLTAKTVLKVLWRSVIGVNVMAFAVYFAIGGLEEFAVFTAMVLSISVGVIAYTVTVFSLWVLSGRPSGPEEYFLTTIGQALSERFKVSWSYPQ